MSARLRTQPLGEARVIAKQKLMARIITETIVKYRGRVSARLRTQLLREARMLAKPKLMARMQELS